MKVISNLKKIVSNNKLIIENYFFMTFLQFLNSFLYLLIYPFLILKLGVENYGIYVFSLTVITFLIYFVNFGFDLPALRKVSESGGDVDVISEVFSKIFFCKLYLLAISIIPLYFLKFLPIISENTLIINILFIQVIGAVFLPMWYFQARQKMKVLTIIQVVIKIITLPLIFAFVGGKSDLWVFTLIATLGIFFSSLISFIYIIYKDGVTLKFKKIWFLVEEYKEALPFFTSVAISTTKDQFVVIILGLYFGVKEVALYDLAMKIVSIPRTILVSLNTAIFPKVIKNLNVALVKKIIKIELLIGIFVICAVLAFGGWVVDLLGGKQMQGAHELSVILSGTVAIWLVVGAYIYFCFVPKERGDIVYKNQIVALFSMLFFLGSGLYFYNDINVFAYALLLSGICEIVYCRYEARKLGFV